MEMRIPSGAGTTLQGLRVTLGTGQGRKYIKSRYGRWRPAVVDSCPGGQAIQDRKRRRGIGCKKSGVAQSQGGGSGGA